MNAAARNTVITTAFLLTGSLSTPPLAIAASGQPTEIQKAMTVSEGVENRDAELATKYIDARNFKNHDPMESDGVAGIQGFIAHLPPAHSPLKVVRAFQDGAYVFTQSDGHLFGPKVLFDIYRFENGLIVEHWQNRDDAAERQRAYAD